MVPAQAEVELVKPLVRREVLRQVFAPRRVIMPRLALYYLQRLGLERPWVSAYNAIRDLERAGRILSEPIAGAKWYYLPNVDPQRLAEAKVRKVACYQTWNNDPVLQRGARHAERLWRHAFAEAGWAADPTRKLVLCPLPDDADHISHEIDVFAQKFPQGFVIGGEAKNGLTEGWIDPDVVREWNLSDEMRSVRHHFRAMDALNITPILFAPIVDRSFYVFQGQHRGLHAQYLYHVFDPADAAVARQVKEVFRLGHVWAGSEPPPNFGKFVERIPAALSQYT